METWPDTYPTKNLKIHPPPASKLAQIKLSTRYMRSLIQTFSACLGLETHDFAQRLLKIQTFFSEFQGSENPPKCPKLWSLDFLGPASEAPGPGRPWRPPRRLCSAKALPPRPGRGAPPRAAAFGLRRFLRGPSAAVAEAAGDDERCEQRSSITRSTDKRMMNLLGSTSSKLFQAKKHSETSFNIHLSYSITVDETLRNVCN